MAFGDTATLVSNFDGADENPLSEGGNWAKLNTSEAGDLQRNGNAVTGTTTVTASRYWTPGNYGPDLEAYFTIVVKPDNGSTCQIAFRIQGEGGANTWDGYTFQFAAAAGTDTWAVFRVDNAGFTSLLSGSREFTSGEKMGVSMIGSQISMYVFTGGSWELLGQTSDPNYPAAGKLAIRTRNTTVRLDDFFAGTISGQVGQTVTNVLGRGNAW